MREILFRGFHEDENGKETIYLDGREIKGEWVEGNLFVPDKSNTPTQICIGTNIVRITYDVIPETVGQYTGLTDKNGKKIFEGDIIKSCEYDDIYFIRYFDDENYPAFDCVPDVPLCECNGLAFLVNTEGCEVIGNIFSNPEMLRSECE